MTLEYTSVVAGCARLSPASGRQGAWEGTERDLHALTVSSVQKRDGLQVATLKVTEPPY
jgi:hypothetical protein